VLGPVHDSLLVLSTALPAPAGPIRSRCRLAPGK